MHREFKRKSVTLFLLWEEYKAAHPDSFQYSWFCQPYRAFAKKVHLVMRHSHRAAFQVPNSEDHKMTSIQAPEFRRSREPGKIKRNSR